MVWSLLFFGLATLVFTLASLYGWPLGVAVIFGFFTMAIPVPWVGHALWRLVETRRVMEAGATIEDLRHAAEVTRARREEEMRFDATRPIHWLPKLVRVGSYSMFGVAGAVVIAAGVLRVPFFDSPAFLAFALSTLAGIGGALTGLLIPGRRVKPVDPWARGRAWFWKSPFSRLFAKVAGMGLRRTKDWAAWRPTEAALGSATETLYAALPSKQQQALLDLPNVVSRLEHEAAFARTQLERDVEGPWAERLEAAVGAIETLRLGLLRMHAQQGEAGALTADLDAARDLAERIDYAVSAEAEVAGLLDQSRHQNTQAPPSASPPTTSLG